MINKAKKGNSLIKNVLGALLAVCVVFSVSVPLFASPDDTEIVVVDPINDSDRTAAFLYDNQNGLPTSEANAIAETSDGFIWIGSYGGLIRYDGKTFERFSSTTGIASVVSLFVDSKERLWIGTNDNGAAVMDRYGHISMFSKLDGLPASMVKCFAEDAEGNIYMGTSGGVAVVDTDLNLSVIDNPLINGDYVKLLEQDSDGNIYGLTLYSDVFTISGGTVSGFYSQSDLGIKDKIHTLHADPDNPGYVYLGTEGSQIFYGSLKNGTVKDKMIFIEPLEYINSIFTVGDEVWVCAKNGICRYRNNNVEFLENVPMQSNVEGGMCDYQGNLWFVSTRQGVMKVVPNQFTDLFERHDIKPGVVNSTCYCDDMLFVGMDSGLTVIDKNGVVSRINLDSCVTASGDKLGFLDLVYMLKDVRIRSIIKDSKDVLWLSTFSDYGLVKYDHGKVISFSASDGMPEDNRVRSVYECRDGSYLVACTGGVVVIKDDKIVKTYGQESGMTNLEVLTVCEGPNGDILCGTDGGGIYVLGSVGIRNLNNENGLRSEIIMRIKKDVKHDVYWIVTSNSLAYMTSDYEIHTIEQFPYSNNFDLYENSQGEVWVLSSNGIYVVQADELIANEEIETVFYGTDNGLSIISTSNSYSCVDKAGNLYIAGTTGVIMVNIENPFENVSCIKMTVPYADADGVKIYPDDNGVINIPYNAKKVTIYPYICTYTLINPTLTYYLEGFDREKITTRRSEMTSIDYTNLKGGKYTFKMTLSDSTSDESNTYSISIVKRRTAVEMLWSHFLLYVLTICGITIIVYIYTNKKTKALLKKQEEDKTLIREIVEAFAKTIDMKDRYTRGHSTRVAHYTAMLAEEMGYNEETVEKYRNIALLHDIGKIGVRGEVLNKNGRLEDDEFAEIKSHTTKGAHVLKDISLMPELSIGAEAHHERPDGKGYPHGLKGDEIPVVAQIIAVADTFDAMYSDRPYRKRMNFDKVVQTIKSVAGTQLSEEVVEAFVRIVERGGFKAANDDGGGSTEDIDNIHKRFNKEAEEAHKHEAEESGNDNEASEEEEDK